MHQYNAPFHLSQLPAYPSRIRARVTQARAHRARGKSPLSEKFSATVSLPPRTVRDSIATTLPRPPPPTQTPSHLRRSSLAHQRRDARALRGSVKSMAAEAKADPMKAAVNGNGHSEARSLAIDLPTSLARPSRPMSRPTRTWSRPNQAQPDDATVAFLRSHLRACLLCARHRRRSLSCPLVLSRPTARP